MIQLLALLYWRACVLPIKAIQRFWKSLHVSPFMSTNPQKNWAKLSLYYTETLIFKTLQSYINNRKIEYSYYVMWLTEYAGIVQTWQLSLGLPKTTSEYHCIIQKYIFAVKKGKPKKVQVTEQLKGVILL